MATEDKASKKRSSIANSRVFWTLLLVGVSFTFAFPISGVLQTDPPLDLEIFGESMTRSQAQEIEKGTQAVQLLNQLAGLGAVDLGVALFSLQADISPADFLTYRKEAQRQGIRVSDAELGEARRRLWRGVTTLEKAREKVLAELPDTQDPNAGRMLQFQLLQAQQELLADAQKRNLFDVDDWSDRVRRLSGMNSAAVEESIRDALAIKKLEDQVRARVVVTDKEVFDRFVEKRQRRQVRWLELTASEDLLAKAKAAVTDAELETHLRVNRKAFHKDLSIRCDYLILPRQHFVDAAKAGITEEELRTSFEATRTSYPRPGIPMDTGFELLSAEDEQARRAERFLSFEEAKEKVREKLSQDRGALEVRGFEGQLATRLRPASGEGESFAKLVAEFPFLEMGSVPPTSAADPKSGFGAAYSVAVNGWYETASTEGDLSETQRKALPGPFTLPENAGFVYYRGVYVIDPRDPELAEVRDEVLAKVVEAKVAAALEEAARKKSAEIDAGTVKLEAVAGTSIDVTIAPLVTAPAQFQAVETSSEQIERTATGIKVKGASSIPAASATSDPDVLASAAATESTHPSSGAILAAAFAIPTQGKCSVARDESKGRCYLVDFIASTDPDSAEFEDALETIRAELVREREKKTFDDWLQDLSRRARGTRAEDAVAAVQD
jgi:hypothetical protein